jgi:hypothetical protein
VAGIVSCGASNAPHAALALPIAFAVPRRARVSEVIQVPHAEAAQQHARQEECLCGPKSECADAEARPSARSSGRSHYEPPQPLASPRFRMVSSSRRCEPQLPQERRLSAEQRRALEILSARWAVRLRRGNVARPWVPYCGVGRPGLRRARHGAPRDHESSSDHGRRPERDRRQLRANRNAPMWPALDFSVRLPLASRSPGVPSGSACRWAGGGR